MRQHFFTSFQYLTLIDAQAAHRPRRDAGCEALYMCTLYASTAQVRSPSGLFYDNPFSVRDTQFVQSCNDSVWHAQARRSATAWWTQPRQALEGLLRKPTTAAPAVALAPGPAAAPAAAPTRGRRTCRRCAAWRPTARRRCWSGAASHPAMQSGRKGVRHALC